MSWTGSENQRRQQGVVRCPARFRGSNHYASKADCNVATLMTFGKFKGHRVVDVPDWYLRWFVEKTDGRAKLKAAARKVLAERE